MTKRAQPAGAEALRRVATSGPLCRGRLVTLGWPEPHEFDAITGLRNSERVRRWFLDSRLLGLATNRRWLASGMRRPFEALLSIRWGEDGGFLGTCGWSDWNPATKTVWMGRLAVSLDALRRRKSRFPPDYAGVTLDAATALRDFAFQAMGVEAILTFHFIHNKRSERVVRLAGLVETGRKLRKLGDGSEVETVEMMLTRERWEALRRS